MSNFAAIRRANERQADNGAVVINHIGEFKAWGGVGDGVVRRRGDLFDAFVGGGLSENGGGFLCGGLFSFLHDWRRGDFFCERFTGRIGFYLAGGFIGRRRGCFTAAKNRRLRRCRKLFLGNRTSRL